MKRIAIFGDPVLDQIYQIRDQLHSGGKVLGAYCGAVPGGTTSNFSCAAARFGLSASVTGRVADNWEGALHAASLQKFGVSTTGLKFIEAERGAHTVIAIDGDGEKTLIYIPLDKAEHSKEQVKAALADCDLAYVMATDFHRIAGYATAAEICVDFDAAAGLSGSMFTDVRDNTDVIFINDIGCKKLTGKTPSPSVLAELLGERATLICCTGGGGITSIACRQAGGIETISRPAINANVVDTTGAGDCFNAAFLAMRASGSALEKALDFAMAAGALTTEKLGARAAIPSFKEVIARIDG